MKRKLIFITAAVVAAISTNAFAAEKNICVDYGTKVWVNTPEQIMKDLYGDLYEIYFGNSDCTPDQDNGSSNGGGNNNGGNQGETDEDTNNGGNQGETDEDTNNGDQGETGEDTNNGDQGNTDDNTNNGGNQGETDEDINNGNGGSQGNGGNTDQGTSDEDISMSKFSAEVVRLVNIERAKYGLSALSVDSKVQQAAQIRAQECMISFSHTRPDGQSCFTALKEVGATYNSAGENIAMGQKTPAQVVNAWMNSEGHRKNILNGNFKYIGVGFYEGSNGTYYWSQFFTY